MSSLIIQSETLEDIADAIRAKTGGSSPMTPAQMATTIGNITIGSTTFALKYVVLDIAGKITDSAQGEWYYYTASIKDYVNGNNFVFIFDYSTTSNGTYNRCVYSPALSGNNNLLWFNAITNSGSNRPGVKYLINTQSNGGLFGGAYTGMRGEIHDNRIFIRRNSSSIVVPSKGLLIYAEAV